MNPPIAPSEVVDAISLARDLVFDFDGTLVDSNSIKRAAFERCFQDFPGYREEIGAYCSANHHTPRWEKFRRVYEKVLRLPYTRQVENQLLHCFEQETTDRIAGSPETEGASDFLKAVKQGHRIGLLSSTPHRVLLEILRLRQWESYFHWIQGAPVDKAQRLRSLSARQGQAARALVFFGDTPEDAEAAYRAGCGFIHVGPAHEAPAGSLTIPDFRRLVSVRRWPSRRRSHNDIRLY